MADYLLDTNHASPLVTLTHPLRRHVLSTKRTGDGFAICAPVLTELLFGIGLLPRAQQNQKEWDDLRSSLTFYRVDEADAEMASSLQLTLRRQGRQLTTVDALIAAVAIRYGLTLLTTDKDFRPITQLKQENWIRP